MLIKNIFKFSILFALVLANAACAATKCTYSESVISEKEYTHNSLISVFHWFPNTNEIKGVLKNGNLFSIKHWSCSHYGKHAAMIIGPQMQEIPETLNAQVKLLADIALSQSEREMLMKAIGGKPLKLADAPSKVQVLTDEFSEFYVQTYIVGEAIFVEIKLYKD